MLVSFFVSEKLSWAEKYLIAGCPASDVVLVDKLLCARLVVWLGICTGFFEGCGRVDGVPF